MRRAACTALLSLLLTACGSTVQLRTTGTVGQDGLGGPDGSGGLGTSTGAAVPGGTGVTSPVAGAGSATQGSSSPTGSSTSGTGAAVPPGTTTPARARPGSTKEPIRIGVITQPGLESAAKALGLDGVTTGNTKAQVNAVLGWIRAHGGLAGHPVSLYEFPVNMSDSANVWQTKACTAMVQDDKVRFVITVLANLQTLARCLAKADVGLLGDNTNMGDSTLAQFAPILADPSELAPGRMMTLLVDDLFQHGWLTGTTKVGVLAADGVDGHATVDGPLAAALRRHGVKSWTTVYINPDSGDGGSSASSNAVLTFRAAGVDRVIPVLYSPLYFMVAAETQHYAPAYAMVSANGPGALLEGSAPKNQLENAAGIGWAPFLDIGKGPKPPPVSARQTLCFQLMAQAGQAAQSALVKGFQAQVCDVLFYLKDLSALRPDLPRDLLTSARAQLGSRFVSPATWRVDVTHRTAGVGAYRHLAYLDSCSCFQYVGGLVAAG